MAGASRCCWPSWRQVRLAQRGDGWCRGQFRGSCAPVCRHGCRPRQPSALRPLAACSHGGHRRCVPRQRQAHGALRPNRVAGAVPPAVSGPRPSPPQPPRFAGCLPHPSSSRSAALPQADALNDAWNKGRRPTVAAAAAAAGSSVVVKPAWFPTQTCNDFEGFDRNCLKCNGIDTACDLCLAGQYLSGKVCRKVRSSQTRGRVGGPGEQQAAQLHGCVDPRRPLSGRSADLAGTAWGVAVTGYAAVSPSSALAGSSPCAAPPAAACGNRNAWACQPIHAWLTPC